MSSGELPIFKDEEESKIEQYLYDFEADRRKIMKLLKARRTIAIKTISSLEYIGTIKSIDTKEGVVVIQDLDDSEISIQIKKIKEAN